MLDFSNLTSHQDTLVELQNALNNAEGDLVTFYEDTDPAAGHEVLTSLRQAGTALDALIEELQADVEAAEAENDAHAEDE